MRLTYLLLILILWSCGQSEKSSSKKVVEKPTTEIKKEAESQKNPSDNSKTATQREIPEGIVIPNDSIFKLLVAKFGDAPFYCQPKEKTFYIVSNRQREYENRFDGNFKYGISDDSLNILLPMNFDKIYNPDLVIENCFEIKKNGKVGLYNYETGQILYPRFDFIIPEEHNISNIAFGKVADKWYKIDNSDLTRFPVVNYNPKKILNQLNFDVHDLGASMMYDSYYDESRKTDPIDGQGMVFVPSYIEYFKLTDKNFLGVILPKQTKGYDFGIEKANLTAEKHYSISENIIAFFFSFYEEGIGGREYFDNSESILIYNNSNSQKSTIETKYLTAYGIPCHDNKSRFVNDSILEVRFTDGFYNDSDKIGYSFETNFKYYLIKPDGEVQELKSNRHFDYTKFIYIDAHQFEGCFGAFKEEMDYKTGENLWLSDHLSIEDLDIMRNEIFAEYGYKFKSEKWQEYFINKSWYKPIFDNVDDQLTDIDKANIKVILKVKEEMLIDEKEFTKKRAGSYHAAG